MPYTPYQSTWQNPYLPLTNQGQPVMPMVQPYQQSVSGVIKVNGRDSALQYSLPPNSMSPALFDNNGQVFYIVSTDGTGTKTVEVFDFSPHVEEKPISIDGAQFVSRKEFDEFTTKVNAALGAINGVHAAVPSDRQPAGIDDERPNQYAQEPSGWQPSGGGGAAGQVQRDVQAPQRYDDARVPSSSAVSGEVPRRGF